MRSKTLARVTIEDCSANRAPGRLIRRLEQDLRALVERRFAHADISFTQWIGLKVVRDKVVTNAGELSHELNITSGATTRLIDTLEERGLMVRSRSAEDRRVVGLEITDAGIAMLFSLAPAVEDGWNAMLVDFEDAELDQLVSLLARLLNAAERELGKANNFLDSEAAE